MVVYSCCIALTIPSWSKHTRHEPLTSPCAARRYYPEIPGSYYPEHPLYYPEHPLYYPEHGLDSPFNVTEKRVSQIHVNSMRFAIPHKPLTACTPISYPLLSRLVFACFLCSLLALFALSSCVGRCAVSSCCWIIVVLVDDHLSPINDLRVKAMRNATTSTTTA